MMQLAIGGGPDGAYPEDEVDLLLGPSRLSGSKMLFYWSMDARFTIIRTGKYAKYTTN